MACSPGVRSCRSSLMLTPWPAADSVAVPTLLPCPFCRLTLTGAGALSLALAARANARSATTTSPVFIAVLFIFVYLSGPNREQWNGLGPETFRPRIVHDQRRASRGC